MVVDTSFRPGAVRRQGLPAVVGRSPDLDALHAIVRPVLAWMLACAVAGAAIYLLLFLPDILAYDWPRRLRGFGGLAVMPLPFLTLGLVVAGLTFWAAPALLWLVRRLSLPRPWADIALGAMPACIVALSAFHMSRDPLHAGSEWIATLLLGAASLLIPGCLAGLAYWLAAGRPRPPY